MPGMSVIIDAIKESRRYPEALRFTQPLSGIIAGRRDYLMKLTFEDGYGVDCRPATRRRGGGCREGCDADCGQACWPAG